MTNQNKKTVILARVISSMFNSYKDDEKTRVHKEIQVKIQRGYAKSLKKYGVIDVKETIELGKQVWYDTIDNFQGEENITIEASSLILNLVAEDEKALGKNYSLNKGILERWATSTRREDALEIEESTRVITSYLINLINFALGIESKKKPSVLAAIRWSKQENKQ